ncbi:MAG: carboxypeptidase-like regulatory domain-containing protein [Deltaproteobacteria bacterium]
MKEWVIVRHSAAVAGRVSDAQRGKIIKGARVAITAAPSAFTDWLATWAKQFGERWQRMAERPDRTRTDPDGHFHFLDLPDGTYSLTATLPGSGSRYGAGQQGVTVTRDAEGHAAMASVEIALPPTTVRGQITAPDTSPVIMAEIRIKGSGERVFSESGGQYLIAGVETGNRTVLVSAKGFQSASQTVNLRQAGDVETLNFTLTPTSA